MSDMEEPLSAILAEMKRRADEAHEGLNGVADTNQIDYMEVESWAERIEDAVERERFITDALLAVKDKPLPHPDPDNAPPVFAATGNAAALREALRECLSAALQIRTLISYTSPFQGPDRAVRVSDLKPVAERIERAFDGAKAALAAPARNCDANEKDAMAMWNGYKMSAPCPPGGWDERDLFGWLFAPAEGGAK